MSFLLANLHLIFAQAATCAKDGTFFGLPVWYKYLPYKFNDVTGRCEVILGKDITRFWLVGLGILDILLRLAGIIAVGFVIYGGTRYVLSQGEPDQVKAAKDTIINALIGVIIAASAVMIVSFIGGRLGG